MTEESRQLALDLCLQRIDALNADAHRPVAPGTDLREAMSQCEKNHLAIMGMNACIDHLQPGCSYPLPRPILRLLSPVVIEAENKAFSDYIRHPWNASHRRRWQSIRELLLELLDDVLPDNPVSVLVDVTQKRV